MSCVVVSCIKDYFMFFFKEDIFYLCLKFLISLFNLFVSKNPASELSIHQRLLKKMGNTLLKALMCNAL